MRGSFFLNFETQENYDQQINPYFLLFCKRVWQQHRLNKQRANASLACMLGAQQKYFSILPRAETLEAVYLLSK